MFHLGSSSLLAAAIWGNTNDATALWRVATNWISSNTPRLSRGTTYITNRSSKTVILDDQTPAENLFINTLNLWAPAGSTNALWLRNAGTNAPLVISNQSMTIADRGRLILTNSSLVLTGNFLNFSVWAGEVVLDSGLLVAREEPPSSNVTVITRLGRTNQARLTIRGGEMQVTQLLLGDSPGSTFARGRGDIAMSGGRLSIASEFSLGDSLGCTGVVQLTGGEIVVANQGTNITRVGDHGYGEMSVSNALFRVGNVSVARHDGSLGVLSLRPGGFYWSDDDLNIGRFSGATGTVQVLGGTLACSNNPIWIGREGRGSLLISDGLVAASSLRIAAELTNTSSGLVSISGGQTVLTSSLLVGDGLFSNASLTISGGILRLTNAQQNATLSVLSGTASVTGGNLELDDLTLTNTLGAFVLGGGRLTARNLNVANGAPFVVGDGVQRAELILNGGTFSFANGLIISSNAVLSGCGSIQGTIVNHGLMSTAGYPTAPSTPNWFPPTVTAQGLQLGFPTRVGVTYLVEFTADLGSNQWTPLTNHLGQGTPFLLDEPNHGIPARFYRVRLP